VSARRTWLPFAFTLLAGVLLGVIGMAAWIHHRLDVLREDGPEAISLHVLDHELDLDDPQEQQAREILRRIHQHVADFHHAHVDELHAILGQGAAELQAILRPDQVVDWQDLHDRMLSHLLMSGLRSVDVQH
jgi:hypothetical protein